MLRKSPLPDIQASADTRGLDIDQVGVSDLRYPIHVLDHDGKPFPTVAKISMSVTFRIISRART